MQAVARLKSMLGDVVGRHGAKAAFAAKTLLSLFMPGGGLIAEVVCNVIELSQDMKQDALEDKIQAELNRVGDDAAPVQAVIDELNGRLGGLMSELDRKRGEGQAEPQLQDHVAMAIAQDPGAQQARKALGKIQGQLISLEPGQKKLHDQVKLGVDAMAEVDVVIEGALTYFRSAEAEGVPAEQARAFVLLQAQFQRAIADGEIERATELLSELERVAPSAASVPLYRAALQGIAGDLTGANKTIGVAQNRDSNSATLRKVTQAIQQLTRQESKKGCETAGAYKVGDTIGDRRWKLEQLLGQGGMGRVWRVSNRRGAGALKLMLPALAENKELRARFIREIDLLDDLRHPNVVRLLDYGDNEPLYLVTEYIEGKNLSTHLRQNGGLDEARAREMFAVLAEGLAACHKVGVVHRDIKPENIMVRADGTPVLIDFGIAQVEGSALTQMGSMYTQQFASPEQIRGGQVGPPSDVFSLAATMVFAMAPDWSRKWNLYDAVDQAPGDLQPLLDKAVSERRRKRMEMSEFGATLKGAPVEVKESTVEAFDTVEVHKNEESKGESKEVAERRKAAEQGDAIAQSNLGWCYDNGEGVEQDPAQAAQWYRKAAEQGHAGGS